MIAGRSHTWPRILAERLDAPDDPLVTLLTPRERAHPAAVARLAALALLDSPATTSPPLAPWLAPHQAAAARRLLAILARHGGAVLADAVGLGKSYVALAVARALAVPFALVVPAVLLPQWRDLMARLGFVAPILTHEWLSDGAGPPRSAPHARLLIVDEAHRFRHPATRRYRRLARLAVGRALLLVTATPVHNRLADLFQLLRLFLRDDVLTALGVASLRAAARGALDATTLQAAAARLVVARSRAQITWWPTPAPPLRMFPARAATLLVRADPAPTDILHDLAAGVTALSLGGRGAALLRLLLLTRLASSLAAFRATVARLEALATLVRSAADAGRTVAPREVARILAADDRGEMQLALLPMLLAEATTPAPPQSDPLQLRALRQRADAALDPKAGALADLLARRPGKTIVFATARATVRHLAGCLGRRFRVAALDGGSGRWGTERVAREEVLRAFAPAAQGAAPPPAALVTDVLLATDLVSEGLNLQDAVRVVHYDLPWSPARLAQRVGRIDRIDSPHHTIETVTFLPSETLERAIEFERRLALKGAWQRAAGAAAVEGIAGRTETGALDWCDRLQSTAESAAVAAPAGVWAAVTGCHSAVLLCVRLGGPTGWVEAVVVDATGVRADPVAATRMLESPATAMNAPSEVTPVRSALHTAAPWLRGRLAALAARRWRSADRDAPGRRLIAWVLAAARRAARRGDASLLARLDGLVARLAHGMTAGEELLLEDLLQRRTALRVNDLLAWHERLPPLAPEAEGAPLELVAALVVSEPSPE